MKKLTITIFVLLIGLVNLYFALLPNIDYSKLEYFSYSSQSNQSLNSVDTEDPLPNNVIIQLHLDYDEFKKNNMNNQSFEEIIDNKHEFRQQAKKYHEDNNSDKINDQDLGCYQDLYVSSYSPFIDITYDYDYYIKHKNNILAKLTNNCCVKTVNVIESYQEIKPLIDFTANLCDAETVYESRNKTGSGVVVGILEDGVIDTSHSNLQNTDITIKSSIYNLTGKCDHTTQMAMAIAGSEGIAPNTKILNAYLSGTMNAEIDWMLDNDVDIINMSFGYLSDFGEYNNYSAYADYIVYTYNVLIVAAAGNNDGTDGYISNPALGYNVITVGAYGAYQAASFSSYLVTSGPIKPTISVPGEFVYLLDEDNTVVSGTSISAALCSGLLALILEDYPLLTTHRAKLLALMCVNTGLLEYHDFTEENGFDSKVGAGVFNYQNMIDNYTKAYYCYNCDGLADSIYTSVKVYVKKGQTIRACCAVIAKATGSKSATEFTDYDVFIRNSSGELVAFGNSWTSTIDITTYTATLSGYYTVELYQATDRVTDLDNIGLAYRIYD